MEAGPRAASREVGRLVEAFGRSNVAVELWDHGDPLDTARNDALALLAAEWGVDAVATNNVHYATPAGFRLATTLAAIRARRPLAELEGWLPSAPTACLRGAGEQLRRFARWPGVVERAGRVGPGLRLRPAAGGSPAARFPRARRDGRAGLPAPAGDPGRARALRPTPRRAGAGGVGPDRARARGHRRSGVCRLLPGRVGHRRGLPPPRHLLPGPGLGRQLRRLLRPRGHQRRRRRPGAALRAVPVPGPRRSAGHRRRHRVRPAGGGHPVRLRALRPPSRGAGGQRHHLPPPLGRARRGQGLRVHPRAGGRVGVGDRPGQPGRGGGRGGGGGGARRRRRRGSRRWWPSWPPRCWTVRAIWASTPPAWCCATGR